LLTILLKIAKHLGQNSSKEHIQFCLTGYSDYYDVFDLFQSNILLQCANYCSKNIMGNGCLNNRHNVFCQTLGQSVASFDRTYMA